jgi:hypothetical protein
MTARDDAIDSRLRALAHETLAELGRTPGYDRDVPQARRLGSMRTLALAGGLAAAFGAAGAALGIGLHQSGQHGPVPGPAASPTPASGPATPTPSATPVAGSLGNDLIYSADGADPHGVVTTLTEHDWTWAVRGHLTLPKVYSMQYIIASPHGSHVLLVDGPVVGFTDASGGTSPTTLTSMSSGGQTVSIPTPPGLVLTSIPKWSDDDSVVCASAGKSNSTGTATTTDDFYILKAGSPARKMSVPTQGLSPDVLACSPSKDLMVVELIRQGGIDGSPGGPDEVYVARMSTGVVLRHLTLPKPTSTQAQPSAVPSADATLLAISNPTDSNAKSTIEDSATGRTLATLAIPAVNFFAGVDSLIVGTDANGRTVLMEWQTGQQIGSDWLAQLGIQAVGFMFHAGQGEVLVEIGPQVYIVNGQGQERKVSDQSYVVLVRNW